MMLIFNIFIFLLWLCDIIKQTSCFSVWYSKASDCRQAVNAAEVSLTRVSL